MLKGRYLHKRHLVQNLVLMLRGSAPAYLWIYLLELFILDQELSFIFSSEILKLDTTENKSQIEASFIFSRVGWFDFQTPLVASTNMASKWVILLIVLFLLTAIALVMSMKTRALKSALSSTVVKLDPQISSFTRWIVYLYGYLFYVVGYFGVSFFLCRSIRNSKLVEALGTNLQIMTSDAKTFDSSLQVDYTAMWTINPTKKCLSEDYFVMNFFTALLIGVNFYIQYLNNVLIKLYPAQEIYDCQRGLGQTVRWGSFFVVLVFKNVLEILRSSSWINTYYYCIISLQVFNFVVVLFSRQNYNPRLQLFKVCRTVVVVVLAVLLLIMRDGSSDSVLFVTSNFVVISLLAGTVCLKLIFILIGQLDAANKTDPAKLKDLDHLVFEFESCFCADRRDNAQNERRRAQLKLFLIRVHSHHTAHCNTADCRCRNLDLWVEELGELASQNIRDNRLYFFTMQTLLGRKLAYSAAQAIQDASSLEKFKLFALFCLRNVGVTSSVITTVLRIKNTFQTHQQADRPSLKSQKAKKFIGIYEDTLINLLVSYIGKYDSNPVAKSDLSKDPMKRTHLDRRGLDQVKLYPALDYINRALDLEAQVQRALTLKILMTANMIQRGEAHQIAADARTFFTKKQEIEQLVLELRADGSCLYLKVGLLRAFYLFHVKEDLVAALRYSSQLSKRNRSSNIALVLDLELSKVQTNPLVVVGVLGGPEKVHTISYITSNVTELGYDKNLMVGENLNIFLPTPIAKFHQSLFVSHRSVSKYVMTRPSQDLYVMSSDGHLLRAEVTYRISTNLERGTRA